MTAILATFESRCAICDEPIYEDEPIVFVEDEWVHEACEP